MEYHGCTKERKSHSRIVIEIREVTAGGMPISYGQRDTEHSLLDFLKEKGLLGRGEDETVRHDTGYKLRDLYYSFHSSGKSMQELFDGPKYKFTADEGETTEDYYNAVMRALPAKYRQTAVAVCIDSRTTEKIEQIIDMLDALYGAFYRVKQSEKLS